MDRGGEMLCSNCGKNPAQVYAKRTAEGEKRLFLCPACYKSLYGEGADDFFTTFLGSVEGEKRRACPTCGATMEEFRHTGLLGCADCYRVFREELAPTVRFIQGRLYHAGKSPSEGAEEKYDEVRALAYEQEALRERLKTARDAGDETAAKALKFRLDAINRELNGGDRS